MAIVKIVMSGKDIGEIESGYDIPEADAARILAWASDKFDPGVDGDGNPTPPNPALAISGAARMALQEILTKVVSYEREQAMRRAAESVAPISASQV